MNISYYYLGEAEKFLGILF